MKKRLSFILLLLFLPVTAVFFMQSVIYSLEIDSLQVFFSPREMKLLREGAIITRSRVKKGTIVMTEGTEGKIHIPVTNLIPASLNDFDLLAEEKAFFPLVTGKNEPLALSNMLFAFSRLRGMKYYSKTGGVIETLIIQSRRISSPESTAAVPDPSYGDIREKRMHYFMFQDNRFGNQRFRSELISNGSDFILKNISLEAMRKYGMLVNNAGEYQMIYFFLYDARARGYFYYSLHAMRVRSAGFRSMGLVTPESFGNRLRANTVHFAGLMGMDWTGRISPFK